MEAEIQIEGFHSVNVQILLNHINHKFNGVNLIQVKISELKKMYRKKETEIISAEADRDVYLVSKEKLESEIEIINGKSSIKFQLCHRIWSTQKRIERKKIRFRN